MNERNQWEDRNQWSLGVGQRRKSFETDIYIYILKSHIAIARYHRNIR
jgi:hypothetical protein